MDSSMTQNLTSYSYSYSNKSAPFKWSENNFLEEIEPLDLKFLQDTFSLKSSSFKKESLPFEKSALSKEINFKIEKNVLALLKQAQAYYSVLSPAAYGQAVLALLLYRYTGQKQFGIKQIISEKETFNEAHSSPFLECVLAYNFKDINNIIEVIEKINFFLQDVNPSILVGNNLFMGETKISNQELINISFASSASGFFHTWGHLDQPTEGLFFMEEINEDKICYKIKYKLDKIDPFLLTNFVKTYQFLYQAILEELIASKNIADLPSVESYSLLSELEYQKVIHLWNATESEYPRHKTVHQIFEEQVERTPDHIAIVYEDVKLTYKELNERSNQLAHYLINHYQIKADDLIVLCLDHNEQMMISIMAVWKAGGAYVPMDPSYPNERLGYILQDTRAKIAITTQAYGNRLKKIVLERKNLNRLPSEADWFQTQVFEIEDLKEKKEYSLQPIHNPNASTRSTDLAYVIYTSGTTGQPKGVMIEHKNVLNLNTSLFQKYDFGEDLHGHVILQSSNYVFDSSVEDIVLSLLNGFKLVMMPERLRLEHIDFYNYLNKHKVTYMGATPSFLHQYDLTRIHCLKKISVGGEKITREFITQARLNSNIRIINGYGPTESTVTAVTHSFQESDILAIGRPIANTKCYVLDSHLKPLPVGAIGELYMGGEGLARGYLNRPDLSSEKFISNPFQSEEEAKDIRYHPQGRNASLYKTGDLVRWLGDGNLEYIGRNDSQVKIRGYRIELAEIETALLEYNGIKQSVVVVKNQGENHQYLVAYYIKDQLLNQNNAKEYVNNWESLYQSYYDNLDIHNYKSNINIWTSSYTEQAIPKEDMLEWVEETVKRVKELNPKVILEIGSGSGLILFNIIDNCDYYYATDFSENVVQYTKKVINHFDYQNKIKAICCSAETLPFRQIKQPYDTVILNSVVLHFPDTGYLEKVINNTISHMAPCGQIFIGDVIDYRLLRSFHYSIQHYKKNKVDKKDIEYLIARYKDLSFSPAYFLLLKESHPHIADIEIMPKYGDANHEMNNYRYDVVLHIRKKTNEHQKNLESSSDKLYIQENQFISTNNLIEYLEKEKYQEYIFLRYPNKRILKDYREVNLLYGNFLDDCQEQVESVLSISDITHLANQKGFKAKFFLDVKDPLYFYIALFKNDKRKIYCDYSPYASMFQTILTNNPLKNQGFADDDFGHKLKEYLKGKLPSYMVPNHYILLEKFPLTINGKLDLKELPDPYIFNQDNYVAPRSKLEENICHIWAEVLKIEEARLGICDDFFGLGGNSILAIKVINRLNNELNQTLNAISLFEYRTIQKLSDYLYLHKKETPILPCVLFRPEQQVLSSGQERLWFIHKYAQGTNAYNIPLIFKLSEKVELEFLKESIKKIILRHEILRTLIQQDERGNPYQQIIDEKNFSLVIPTLVVSQKEQLDQELSKACNHIYDLSYEYPIKIQLYKLKKENSKGFDYYISIVVHHIAFDGWSGDLFLRELNQFYQEYLSKKNGHAFTLNLPTLDIQYKDFALWQKREYSQNNDLINQLTYWKNTLTGYENLNLLTDYPRPHEIDYHGRSIAFEIPENTSTCLRQLAKNLKVSLYSVLLAGYCLMLRAYGNQEDIVIGTPIANRNHHQTQNLIGFFVNTLVIRAHIDSYQPLKEFIQDINKAVRMMQLNQDVPFDKLVQELKIERDTSRNPIFQVMFDIQNFADDMQDVQASEETTKLDTLLQAYHPNINPLDIAPFDLTTSIDDRGKSLKGIFNYATSLYNHQTIQGFIETYQEVLRQLAALIHNEKSFNILKIKDVTYLTPFSQDLICQQWNATERDYPCHKTLHQLFEEQTQKTPHQVAVAYKEVSLSYEELNEKANQLAHYLLHHYPLNPDDLVALCLERSERMIVSMLAVLKAGGAYVPLDPNSPDERLVYILQDTKAKLIITDQIHEKRLKNLISTKIESFKHTIEGNISLKIIAFDKPNILKRISSEPSYNLQTATRSNHLAYVIYTSGTTGYPKGVMIEHKSVVNSSYNAITHRKINKESKILNIAPYIFDSSVLDIYSCLLNGSQLFILDEDLRKDIFEINHYCVKNGITHLFLTTRLAEEFLTLHDMASSLVCLTTAGEKLETIRTCSFDIINEYGPTEACVCATQFQIVKDQGNIPIGRPIYNVTAYVLDANLNALPIGAIGELYIGGYGLARGYLARSDLTAKQFIANPFQTKEKVGGKSQLSKGSNRWLYKTGDLVRWLPDGHLEYIGRNDFQVKIRGYRIELREIEIALLEYEGVKQSVVLAMNNHHDQNARSSNYLVGYYVADKPLDDSAITSYLQRRLPEYMVPSILIYLKKLPLTLNGKLDRSALPHPTFKPSENYVAPRNELEEKISQIWLDLLQVDRVGIQDNFFQLGGNSILTIQLVSMLRQKLGFNIHIKDIFTYKTIQNLCDNLTHSSFFNSKKTPLVRVSSIMSSLPDFDPYVLFNENTKNSPSLFILPPAEGGAESYFNNLVPALSGCKLVLFNNYYLYLMKNKSHKKIVQTITYERLASEYIKYIKAIQPLGPYNLCGWSFGGSLAFEIARQFTQQGETVANIILIDTFFSPMLSLEKEIKIDKFNSIYSPVLQKEIDIPTILFQATQSNNTYVNNLEKFIEKRYLKVILMPHDHYSWIHDKSQIRKMAHIIKNALGTLVREEG